MLTLTLNDLKTLYPQISEATRIEQFWGQLPSLKRAGMRATYEVYTPQWKGQTYLEIERREYSDITRWEHPEGGAAYTAYFLEADVLVTNYRQPIT